MPVMTLLVCSKRFERFRQPLLGLLLLGRLLQEFLRFLLLLVLGERSQPFDQQVFDVECGHDGFVAVDSPVWLG